ncbi:MAG: YicC family protein [Desulfovibrionaceae bacterium]|nr:YicC family protein [Desulfovibrionaceae bacterium]
MALCSMTGFGRFQRDDGLRVQTWEVRSVNSRYLDPKWRLPSQARALEGRLEKVLRRHAGRGRVEISLILRGSADSAALHFDAGQAAALLDTLQAFARERGDSFCPDYAALLSIPSLWSSSDDDTDAGLAAALEEGLTQALEDWNAARRAEGAQLAADLDIRIQHMEEWVRQVEKRAPAIKEERFRLVRERLADILGSLGCELEEARFLQEMVIMADRLDVSEELTRLRSHLVRLRELLRSGQDAGRKLDFTLQECFREINTCGNKIQDADLSRLVVDFKNELEKCREQVQNLE